MNRERAHDTLAAEVARLRGAGPLPEATRDRTRELAALWMEEDARRCLLLGATQEARTALQREYVRTGFVPEDLRVFDNGWRELSP